MPKMEEKGNDNSMKADHEKCERCIHRCRWFFEHPCKECLSSEGRPKYEPLIPEGKAEKSPTRTVRVVLKQQYVDGNLYVDVECDSWDIRNISGAETFEAKLGGRIVFRASCNDILYIREVK